MHPRNPYVAEPPNFSRLADAVPALRPFITLNSKGAVTINFKDPNALRALTCALLQQDFRLTVNLPEDRLCPAIPGRLDYILFLQDLLQADRANRSLAGQAVQDSFTGLDIGVGASSVYPLLFCRLGDNVRMYGTDVDETSLQAAQGNISLNQLDNRVQLLESASDGPFFSHVLDKAGSLDFTMCNPPFYTSQSEMDQLASEKEFSPHAVCTGSANEMVTEGGEVAFVSRMVEESQASSDRIRWFSSLLGKATSVKQIVEKLGTLQCSNYALVEFQQGYTQRWAIAWSWTSSRQLDSVARQTPPSPLTKSLPLPNTLSYVCPQSLTIQQVCLHLESLLKELDIDVMLNESDITTVKAASMSWSRAARRAKQRGQAFSGGIESPSDLLLICTLTCATHKTEVEGRTTEAAEISCTWRWGIDRHAFESFFTYLVRKLAAYAN